MNPPSDTQKGAFFSVLAAGLIAVLTVMAMAAPDRDDTLYPEAAARAAPPEQGH